MSRLLDAIIHTSICRRHLVLAGAIALVAGGAWQTLQARFDALPSFTSPRVVVQMEAPGMSSTDVEEWVTTPIEQALLSTPRVASVRSTSAAGLAVIELIFSNSVDIFRARQLVSERLAMARERLPPGVRDPELSPIATPVGALVKFCLTALDSTDVGALSRFAQRRLRPRLLAVQGVSHVTVHGAEAERIEVRPDLGALIAHDLTLQDLERALASAQTALPVGYLEHGALQVPIRATGMWSLDSAQEAIAATVLPARAGLPVRVLDVADVEPGTTPAIGTALYDGRPAVYVQVDKLPWADALSVSRGVDEVLRDLDQALPPGGRREQSVFRQSDFIDRSIGSVGRAMGFGALLVAAILMTFLGSWRLAAISLTAIPLSLLAAATVLLAFGGTVNGMMLGGLAIATGEVVDDAIVDVENIWRRLKENTGSSCPRPVCDVIHDASVEVRGAVVYATLITVAVLTPVMFLGGLTGRIFSPLAVAYSLAMIASLGIALSVTPALCALLLPRLVLRGGRPEPAWLRRLREGYRRALHRIRRRPRPVLVVSLALGGLAVAALPFLGGGYLPEFRQGLLIAEVSARPGTSLVETSRLASTLESLLMQSGLVQHVAARVGRASLDEDAAPAHRIEMDLVLPEDAGDPEERAADIARQMARLPGIRFLIDGFLGERINELLSGERAPVAIKLYGPDLTVLRDQMRRVATAAEGIPGLLSVRSQDLVEVSVRSIEMEDARLARWGLQRSDIVRTVATWEQGFEVARVRAQNGFTVPVVLASRGPRSRQLEDLPILAHPGTVIPLSLVATPRWETEPSVIHHEGGQRVVSVTARAAPGALSAATNDLSHRLAESLDLPDGYRWQLGGRAAERRAASRGLFTLVILVLLAIVGFLWIAFDSLRDAAVVLGGLPLGLVGGVIGALLLPEGVSVAGMVGFVTLAGIISRNGIMLIAHLRHLEAQNPQGARVDLVLRAAEERLLPIFMTAGTAFLGLLPLALSLEGAGSELESPMALIVCFGLISSTALNLVAVPAFLVWQAGRFKETKAGE